jgi:hypothetical protein
MYAQPPLPTVTSEECDGCLVKSQHNSERRVDPSKFLQNARSNSVHVSRCLGRDHENWTIWLVAAAGSNLSTLEIVVVLRSQVREGSLDQSKFLSRVRRREIMPAWYPSNLCSIPEAMDPCVERLDGIGDGFAEGWNGVLLMERRVECRTIKKAADERQNLGVIRGSQ